MLKGRKEEQTVPISTLVDFLIESRFIKIMDTELDAGQYFKPPVNINLDEIVDLGSALYRFGYAAEDRIERRDLVQIYRRIEKDFENLCQSLTARAKYTAAKEVRIRMAKLRDEFDKKLGQGEVVGRQDQQISFKKAQEKFSATIESRHKIEEDKLERVVEDFSADLELTHRIQLENLEKQISRIPRPRMMYSKRTIELIKAEKQLIVLQQYDDAQKVRYMLDKIIPVEKKKFYAAFDASIEEKRTQLRQKQANDLIRADEKIKTIKWSDIRRREKEDKVHEWRINHHKEDMSHAHFMESKLRPEMSVKPSALWDKRPGYASTSASMRGRQLQDHVLGKKKGQQVFAETLIDKHTFEEGSLQDTTTLRSSIRTGGLNR